MLKRKDHRTRPAVSVIWRQTGKVGACQHLRLAAPFSWLERHMGWAPLEYALEPGTPDPRQIRRLAGMNHLTRGHTYRTTRGRAMLASLREEIILTAPTDADAVLVYREATPELIDEAYRLARQRRVPVVYDTDDMLLAVPDDSPLAGHYAGMRPYLTRWIGQADHVTVSNPMLAAELAELNPSIFILPSFMDVDLWGVSEIRPPDDGPVSVGFWGTSTHVPDLQRLTAGFRHLKARYGRGVRFQFMGCHDPELLSLDNVTVGGYVDSYAGYAAATRQCRLDIAIAPLAVNRFNRCKSPIKFFEYSIRGACGVYADLEPYQGVVRPGENGFLIGPNPDDWISALGTLIDDPALRHRMARQAQEDVLAHHTLDRHAWRWGAAYEQVIRHRGRRIALPQPPTARATG